MCVHIYLKHLFNPRFGHLDGFLFIFFFAIIIHNTIKKSSAHNKESLSGYFLGENSTVELLEQLKRTLWGF